jgi:hypothetical protein
LSNASATGGMSNTSNQGQGGENLITNPFYGKSDWIELSDVPKFALTSGSATCTVVAAAAFSEAPVVAATATIASTVITGVPTLNAIDDFRHIENPSGSDWARVINSGLQLFLTAGNPAYAVPGAIISIIDYYGGLDGIYDKFNKNKKL